MKCIGTIIFSMFLMMTSVSYAKAPGVIKTGHFGGDGYNAPQLILQDNHTFEYCSFLNPDHSFTVTGTWTVDKNKLILQSSSTEKFMQKYRILSNGGCLKARQGMVSYRLCNC